MVLGFSGPNCKQLPSVICPIIFIVQAERPMSQTEKQEHSSFQIWNSSGMSERCDWKQRYLPQHCSLLDVSALWQGANPATTVLQGSKVIARRVSSKENPCHQHHQSYHIQGTGLCFTYIISCGKECPIAFRLIWILRLVSRELAPKRSWPSIQSYIYQSSEHVRLS